jgi:hypothetical protein
VASASHSQVRGIPHPLDREYTPVEGTPLLDHRATLPDVDAPAPRKRGITGLMRVGSGEPAQPPSWLALIFVALLGSGGTAGATSLLSPSVAPERIADLEDRGGEVDARVDLLAVKVADIDARTTEAERKMWRHQVITTRWIGDVLVKHSSALAAIAAHLDVEVDVNVPPLLPDEGEP